MERWNGGIVESRNGGKSPQILKDGVTERRNGGKYPQIIKDGMTENHPKSYKTKSRKIARNPKRRNHGKSPEILKDRIAEKQPKSEKTQSSSWHLAYKTSTVRDICTLAVVCPLSVRCLFGLSRL